MRNNDQRNNVLNSILHIVSIAQQNGETTQNKRKREKNMVSKTQRNKNSSTIPLTEYDYSNTLGILHKNGRFSVFSFFS